MGTDDATFSLPGCIARDETLAKHTWYKLGGPARYFATPADEQELADVVRFCGGAGVAIYPLGLGANLLVGDAGVDGCVVRLAGSFWETIGIDGTSLTAAGGVSLAKLVKRCEREGLAGLECLAGVPGTVGGGVRMNAGGRYGDISGRLVAIRVLDRDGAVRELSRDEAGFAYRTSKIAAPFVVSATFGLRRDDPDAVADRTRAIWAAKKDSQPLGGKDGRSCGCAFKNPPGDSAGRLIDAAGLKGTAVGGARVSDRHANFITAGDGCRASDVRRLISLVRRRVEAIHGVRLRPEVRRWPVRATTTAWSTR